MILELAVWMSLVVDGGPLPIEPREPDEASAAANITDVDAGTDGADAGPTQAPDIALTATLEPPTATFGEPFTLVLTLQRDRGVRLELPGSLPEVAGAPAAGPPARTVEDGAEPGRVTEVVRLPFLALDTVDMKTPAFALTATGGVVVDVPSLTVRVAVPPDPGAMGGGADAGPKPDGAPPALTLEGAAPAIAYAVPDARPFVVLAAFASSGILYALVRLAQRRRRRVSRVAPVTPPPPPRPAHEVALERLEALLASGLLQRGETDLFVARLMDEVLRDYLTARFSLSAGTRTTRELVADLLGIAVAGLDVQLVESLLADADLVKFARAAIAPERAHAMATRVRALVESTADVAPHAPAHDDRRAAHQNGARP